MSTSPAASAEFDAAHTYRGVPLETPLPLPTTLLAYLGRSDGQAPFLTTVSAKGDIATLSYYEADLFSRRMAYWLRRELDARSPDVMALVPANDAASAIAILGLMRAGCATLFLNPADPAARLRQQMAASRAKAILRVRSVEADVLEEASEIPEFSTLADPPADFRNHLPAPLADAFWLPTSGSTAASKLVIQSHYGAAVNAAAVARHHQLQNESRLLGCLPVHHVNGLHFTILATLAAGSHAILAHAFDPFSYGRLIERFRPHIASVVPSILEALLETWRAPSLPAEFRYFVSAAAPLSTRVTASIFRKTGARILQGYGLTETINFSTTMPADVTAETYERLMLRAEIPSVGVPLYGNEVAILAEDGSPVRPGASGEICMRGHNVMMRYADNEEATAEAFRQGWFHSQDIGFEVRESSSDRRFFVITGRTKNIAKVRGESVSLDEIERVLLQFPGIRDAACAVLPHRFLGDEIVAAVVAPAEVSDADLRKHLRKVFAANALPQRIVRVNAIPRTATGKVRRPALAEQFRSSSI